MNWKAVGLESGKIYATGSHADCSRAVNEGVSNIDSRANAAITHTEAIRVMREDEYIRSEEEELELIEEKMRLVKEKKHVQLEIKKSALAEEREQKRIDAEREEARKEDVRLEAIAKIQAAREAVRLELAAKKKANKPKPIAKPSEPPEPRKRLKRDSWSSAEEAFIKTNINMPTKELTEKLAERFGKVVTDKAVTRRKAKLREQHGIPARPKRPWTQEEDDYIAENYNRFTAERIGNEIGRTRPSVEARVILLKRGGQLDRGKRYDEKQDYWRVQQSETSAAVHESGEHHNMGVVDMNETEEKMDTIKTIKPEKGDKTAIHMMICKQLNQTYQAKNTDYGDSFSETYRKLGIISAVTRISDKTNRLISLAGKPEAERLVKDENIADTLLDLANYAIMTLAELEEVK